VTSITISAVTHGRYVVEGPDAQRRGLLVGFHGYAESAELHLDRLKRVPGSDAWLRVSIQGLHRFYRRRTREVVASWMTSEDRELAITDNLAYVTAILDAVRPHAERTHVVFAAFSQGVATAVRAACSIPFQPVNLVLLGGEVPAELDRAALARIASVLIGRGRMDEWLTEATWNRDVSRFQTTGVPTTPFAFDGGHEWSDGFSEAVGAFLHRLR
jgi:predicted esterase